MLAARTTLAGITTLALAASAIAPVAAEEAEDSAEADVLAPAAVAGVMQVTKSNQATQSEPGEPPIRTATTNYGWTLEIVADDPRLSGLYETNQSYDSYGSGIEVRNGTGHLVNEGGSWAVELHGFAPPRNIRYVAYFTGEGGYEGLSAMAISQPLATRGTWEFDGVIFPGSMPDPPAWVLPPAD